ncbi:MAG: hypothetical protein L0271_19060 [Gemmatimonadetes bacterium]|nr:hypothetical protein [Gemmatimonadota bacterium]
MLECVRSRSILVVLLATACASAPTPAARDVDPAVADRAVAAHTLERPVEVIFAWTLQEREARFTGDGLGRIAPPHHARVDLFGPRGEAYIAAALVDLELRLPEGVAEVPLPPPSLFWAVLGVLRPPANATLVAATENGGDPELEYAHENERWRFRFQDGRLHSAEWTGSGDGRRTVEIDGDASHGLPAQATYRDWPAFRELRLTVRKVLEVDAFPPGIWSLRDR